MASSSSVSSCLTPYCPLPDSVVADTVDLILDYACENRDDLIDSPISINSKQVIINQLLLKNNHENYTTAEKISLITLSYLREDKSKEELLHLFMNHVKNIWISDNGGNILDSIQRPLLLKNEIDTAFNTLPNWGYNGDSTYSLCQHDDGDGAILKTLIMQAPLSQSNFYVMDIGAGDGEWSHWVARYINKQRGLRDVAIHIISLQGNGSRKSIRIDKIGRCTLYYLTQFKVEEIGSELRKYGFFLEGKIDLAVTSWCLNHLVDSMGTLTQIVNLVRPHFGLFFGDTFHFIHSTEKGDTITTVVEQGQALIGSGAEVLFKGGGDPRGCHNSFRFVIRRINNFPFSLHMDYTGVNRFARDGFHSTHLAKLNVTRTPKVNLRSHWIYNVDEYWGDVVFRIGSKSLFLWFKNNGLYRGKFKHVTDGEL